jgi:hypothetical protein
MEITSNGREIVKDETLKRSNKPGKVFIVHKRVQKGRSRAYSHYHVQHQLSARHQKHTSCAP